MSRGWGIRAALALVFACAGAGLLQAQQQYGDPTAFPGTYFAQRSTPPLPTGQTRIDVTYFVDSSFSATERAVINQAAAAWTTQFASINLVEVNSAAAATIDFHTQNLGASLNLADRTITSVPGAGTYADGSPWRQITGVDITIDLNPPGSLPWFYGPGTVPANQYDYYTLLLREFGLALGLGFATGQPGSAMDADIQVGEQRLSVSPQDLAALQTLYGMPEPGTWALLGVGLLVFGLRRKFII